MFFKILASKVKNRGDTLFKSNRAALASGKGSKKEGGKENSFLKRLTNCQPHDPALRCGWKSGARQFISEDEIVENVVLLGLHTTS
jgi:hypothetical protein